MTEPTREEREARKIMSRICGHERGCDVPWHTLMERDIARALAARRGGDAPFPVQQSAKGAKCTTPDPASDAAPAEARLAGAPTIGECVVRRYVEMGWLGPVLSSHALARLVNEEVAGALADVEAALRAVPPIIERPHKTPMCECPRVPDYPAMARAVVALF